MSESVLVPVGFFGFCLCVLLGLTLRKADPKEPGEETSPLGEVSLRPNQQEEIENLYGWDPSDPKGDASLLGHPDSPAFRPVPALG